METFWLTWKIINDYFYYFSPVEHPYWCSLLTAPRFSCASAGVDLRTYYNPNLYKMLLNHKNITLIFRLSILPSQKMKHFLMFTKLLSPMNSIVPQTFPYTLVMEFVDPRIFYFFNFCTTDFRKPMFKYKKRRVLSTAFEEILS